VYILEGNADEMEQVEAILPAETYTSIRASLDAKLEKLQYARVFMSPADLLEHGFFNTYIKTGTPHLS
jgi:ribonuclease P/MRP protein subunit RPP40